MEFPQEVETELGKALQARQKGNEGQARVCARRAAGLAARQYLERRGHRPASSSAYDVLQLVAGDPVLPPEAREYAAHLTLRVNEDFRLPAGIDLIDEARRLCAALLDMDSTTG